MIPPFGQNCHLQRLGSGRFVVTSSNTGLWMVDGLYEGPAPFRVIRRAGAADVVVADAVVQMTENRGPLVTPIVDPGLPYTTEPWTGYFVSTLYLQPTDLGEPVGSGLELIVMTIDDVDYTFSTPEVGDFGRLIPWPLGTVEQSGAGFNLDPMPAPTGIATSYWTDGTGGDVPPTQAQVMSVLSDPGIFGFASAPIVQIESFDDDETIIYGSATTGHPDYPDGDADIVWAWTVRPATGTLYTLIE